MPIQDCNLNDLPGYKWGQEGKCYTYTPDNEGERRNAKKNAIIQGYATGEYNTIVEITCEKGHPKSNKK